MQNVQFFGHPVYKMSHLETAQKTDTIISTFRLYGKYTRHCDIQCQSLEDQFQIKC